MQTVTMPNLSTVPNVQAGRSTSPGRFGIGSLLQSQTQRGRQPHGEVHIAMCEDFSGSMTPSKRAAADAAVRACLRELAPMPSASVARVAFAGSAELLHGMVPASQALVAIQDGSPPTVANVGGTNLAAAVRLADSLLHGQTEMRTHGVRACLLFTDGMHNEAGQDPVAEAEQLKRRGAVVVCAGFGDDADEALLRRLATTPTHYYPAANGMELARLFARFGQTIRYSIVQGTDPTALLGQL